MNQLALFEAPSASPPKSEASTHRHIVLARLGASGLTNFAWWCRYGNREMCAAVLWKEHGFTKVAANSAVLELSGENSHG
jgi:hypothetical protein